jgi:tetraacyldisaccharide 4'-kinase
MQQKPPLAGPLGVLGAAAYRRVINWRNARFDRRHGVVEFDRPVISVGNLSTGGTGKTPLVKWVVDELRGLGHVPCIAMRGYKSRDGLSDEAEEYRERWPDVPLVVQADRTAGLIDLFATERGKAVDCIVLDDGFQHRQIARQCDLVVIDATRSPFEDRLLPAGHLREEPGSLRRASVVVLTRTDLVPRAAVERLELEIMRIEKLPVAWSRHVWKSIDVSEAGTISKWLPEQLRGMTASAMCAIGNPQAFFEQARLAGVRLTECVQLPDHDPFTGGAFARLKELAARDGGVLVTAKDWVKIRERVSEIPGRVGGVASGLVVDQGERQVREIVCSVFDRFATLQE